MARDVLLPVFVLGLSSLPSQCEGRLLAIRPVLESLGVPFATAGYGPRAVLFRQGDAGDSVLHIETGRVRLAVTSAGGKEAVIGLLAAGAFLGDEVVAGRVVRRHTAIAMAPTEVIVVARARMIWLLRRQPAIAEQFLAHSLAREARLEADLADQLLNSTEQRLARTLLLLADCADRRACRCELPDVSQATIAEMVGTTRAHVNSFMAKFRKRGFIEKDVGGVRVTPSLLHALHDVLE